MTQVIEIQRLHELDDGGELLGWLNHWYAEGHHDPQEFVRALVDYELDEGEGSIPRIDLNEVRHRYMRKVPRFGGTWSFHTVDESGRGAAPITDYNAETPRGGPLCCVRGLRQGC